MKKRFAAGLILTFFAAIAVAGSTLDDYKHRLDAASGYVTDLSNVLADVDPEYQRRMAALVVRTIPASETVDWSGGRVETQNAWLAAAMSEFIVESDKTRQRDILDAAGARLRGTAAAVAEIQRAGPESAAKDTDKQKLDEILKRPEYQPAKADEESLFQRWWREFWEWFDKQFPRPKLGPSASAGLGSLRVVLQVLIFVIVGALIVFLFWRFLPYFSARFGSRGKDSPGDRVILGEIVSANQSASDIFSEAEKLARDGDVRGAIRKGYVAVLCELGDRRLVRIARHKTNRDYLRDVRRTAPVHDGLRGLTENFERNWYGLRAALLEDWEAFRSGYDETLREARTRP